MLSPCIQATVNGRGESNFPLTSVQDIAAWLPDMLLAPNPARETYLIGNSVSWNELVAACEQATGARQPEHRGRPMPCLATHIGRWITCTVTTYAQDGNWHQRPEC